MAKRIVLLLSLLTITISTLFININYKKIEEELSSNLVLAVNVPTTTTTTSMITTTKEPIVTSQSIKTNYIDIVNNAYNNILPYAVREKFKQKGVSLYVTADTKYVEKSYGYKSAIAVADYQNLLLVIEAGANQFGKNSLYRWNVDYNTVNKFSNESATKIILESNVLHEAGHMLDYIYNFSYSENMKNIRIRETDKFKNTECFKIVANNASANINSDKEYFATLFAGYILYGEELKDIVPESYEYIRLALISQTHVIN